MPSADITVYEYTGELLKTELLSSNQTIVLGSFGSAESGLLVDDDNSFGSDDNGTATFNGDPVTYIGSGDATPGVDIAGATLPLGTPKDLVVFEAGGRIFFHYPEGPPNLLSAVAVVTDLEDVPYDGLTPVCFCAGTRIATPRGEVLVEDLAAGDLVLDMFGDAHAIRWIGNGCVDIDAALPGTRDKMRPVCIPTGALGHGMPDADLYLSQQHRVLIDDPAAEMLFAANKVLVPAKALVGAGAHIDYDAAQVTYYHILCEEHVILMANGQPCESLLLASEAQRNLLPEQMAEIELLLDDVAPNGPPEPAAPILTRKESVVLAERRVHR
ncbi:hypothetical protein D6850_00640 [Roseovarius spongiae]|uniref:Hedgehog/Intein (Hint) domain-containing protein n=1 Tax=Roseovarius spongiae TaxID=2320272 RepID=A0A3A8BAG7_9RHOB|nr:Hint domain-containing protein [Roseovarius spongiae]RKF16112.1 hypothetical protein D6850_00640 [Roseovarius spongiae]